MIMKSPCKWVIFNWISDIIINLQNFKLSLFSIKNKAFTSVELRSRTNLSSSFHRYMSSQKSQQSLPHRSSKDSWTDTCKGYSLELIICSVMCIHSCNTHHKGLDALTACFLLCSKINKQGLLILSNMEHSI